MTDFDPARPDDWSWASPELRDLIARDPSAALRERGVDTPADMPADVVREFVRVAYLVWVEGRVVPADRFHIDPADHGLLFARGAWESTRTVGGDPWLWPLHLDRIKQTAALLGMDPAADRLPDAATVAGFVRAATGQDVVVRLNLSAGRPGKPGMVWMTLAPLPVVGQSIRLQACPTPVRRGQAFLTLKTFQYATRWQLTQRAAAAGFDTAVTVDPEGNLLEAAHANLFVRLPDGWVTPPADGALLPGTVRRHLMEAGPIPVREAAVPYARVGEFREAFVTGSSVGLVPVTRIDNHELPIGDETRVIQKWLGPHEPPGGVRYRFRNRPG